MTIQEPDQKPPAPSPKHRKKQRVVKYLTSEEVEAFFRVVKAPRDVAIFRIAYHRGLRASEIGKIQFTDLRLEAGRIQISRLKGSNSFDYPLTKIELKALRAYVRIRGTRPGPLFLSRNGSGISRCRLHVMMAHYAQLAGLPSDKSHMHAWKHSCGTHLAEAGADLLDIKDHLGHKNIQNTLVYVEITSKRREAFADKMKDWK
jgi:type 1 fimbriae regulatory protein FimB